MFKKRLLFLTNHRLTSVLWRDGRVLDQEIFATDEQGQAAFAQSVSKQPGIPACLMVELVEEDFRNDTIPHVMGRDRRAILERKLSQLYRATPYRYAFVQGRESEGRRDDRVLYTAITNPELVRPWVDLLHESRTPLVGIFSAPLLSAHLLRELRIEAEHALLVSLEVGGGLRQSYFQRGEIKFSRLTPVSEIPREQLPAFTGEEVARTWQYLDSLRYFTRNEMLDVYVICHADDAREIAAHRPHIEQVQYFTVDVRDAALHIGLKEVPSTTDATALFVHLLGSRTPTAQFAPHEDTHGMRVWRTRVGLYSASAAILCAALLWGGVNAYRSYSWEREIGQLDQQAEQLNEQQRAIISAFPPTPVPAEVMRDSVTLYDTVLKNSPSPTEAMVNLSHVLERFPNIRVNQIAWGLTGGATALPVYTPATETANASIRSSAQANAQPLPVLNMQDANSALPGSMFEVAVIEAEVFPFYQNYRIALAEIERFTQALKAIPGAQVNALSLPIDITSNAILTGKADLQRQADQARFAVKLVLVPRKS
jgi:hypothetical protein